MARRLALEEGLLVYMINLYLCSCVFLIHDIGFKTFAKSIHLRLGFHLELLQ